MERKDNDLLKKYFDLQKIDSQHATGLNALTSKVSSLYQYDNQMKSKLVNIFVANFLINSDIFMLYILGKIGRQR